MAAQPADRLADKQEQAEAVQQWQGAGLQVL